MNNRKVTIWFIAFFCVSMAWVVSLFAQTNGVPLPGTPGSGGFGSAQTWIDLMTPFIAPLLTAFVKWVMPKIPSVAIPPIAITLGVLVNAIGTVVLGNDVSIVKAVLLGMAGIAIRELTDQVKKLNAPPTP